MPGFRKGKAPDDYVVNKFGSHVEREWREQNTGNRIPRGDEAYPIVSSSQRQHQIGKDHTISRTEESKVTVEFESMPTVPDVSVEGIVIEEVAAEPVNDEKVNQFIEDIRYQFADWKEVVGRAVREGDFVDLDIVSIENPEQLDLKDTRVEVATGKIGQWLYDLLIGMNSGESRDGMSAQEPGKETPEFKPTNVRVTLNSIHESHLRRLTMSWQRKQERSRWKQ